MEKNDKTRTISLSRRIFLYLIGTAFFTVIILGFFWLQSKLSDYSGEVQFLKQTFSETKKSEIKNRVLDVKDYIQWVQNFPSYTISRTLTHQISRLKLPPLQHPGQGQLSLSRAFKDSVKCSRVPVYIVSNSGQPIYGYNPFSNTEDKPLNETEKALLRQIPAENKADGRVIRLKMAAPGDSMREYAVLVNTRVLPGFRVVSMVSQNSFEKVLQVAILDTVNKLHNPINEYIIINSLAGKALVTHGKYNKSPIDILSSGDTSWIKIFKVQQTAATEPEGVFHTYYWMKPSTLKTSRKTSFFSYIPEWRWIIGTGFYEDDIEAIIAGKKQALYMDMRQNILRVVIYLLITSLFCYVTVYIFGKRLGKNIALFKIFFEKAADANVSIDKSQLNFREFAYMAEEANRMVEGRRLTEKALKDSEAHYRYLFEQNPLPMLIYKLNTMEILAVNEAYTNHYGYTTDEALAMKFTNLFPQDEKDAISELSIKLAGYAYTGEWHQEKKDGTRILIETHSNSLFFANQAARIVVINDITERKQAEDGLKKKMEELLRFHNLTVGRELTMIELKKEVNELLQKSRHQEKYRIVE